MKVKFCGLIDFVVGTGFACNINCTHHLDDMLSCVCMSGFSTCHIYFYLPQQVSFKEMSKGLHDKLLGRWCSSYTRKITFFALVFSAFQGLYFASFWPPQI